MRLFFFLLLLPIFARSSISSFEKTTLEFSLSGEEKRQLDLLFSKLFLAQHFGYTLLGDKPVSVSGQFDQLPAGNCEVGAHTYVEEWKTWDRIKKQIQLKNFLLIRLPDFSVTHFNSVTFVNKKAFLRECIQIKASSIFGIILSRFFIPMEGVVYGVNTTPSIGIKNRLKRTQKSPEA